MIHENLSHTEDVKSSSDRSFGMVMAVACAVLALYPLISNNHPHWWLLAICITFLLLALAKPNLLAPLNSVWTRFGLLLGKVVNPVVLGLMYYLIVSPIAIVMKISGRDALKLKFAPDQGTYWQSKDPAGPIPETMRNQY